jgi:hypothetical protein
MTRPHYALRAVLALTGIAIVFLGLNIGLGGIQTLGWQGSGDFLTVADEAIYDVRDNHIRFIGGVWLAVGLVLLAGAVALTRLRVVLLAIVGMIFVGGLTRLSAGDMGLLASGAVAPSLILELIGFPLLGLWIARAA